MTIESHATCSEVADAIHCIDVCDHQTLPRLNQETVEKHLLLLVISCRVDIVSHLGAAWNNPRQETHFLLLLSVTTHSTSSRRQFVHGEPFSTTSQRTLRARQQWHAFEARRFTGLLLPEIPAAPALRLGAEGCDVEDVDISGVSVAMIGLFVFIVILCL